MKGNIIEEYKDFIQMLKDQNDDLKCEVEDLREANKNLWSELKEERAKPNVYSDKIIKMTDKIGELSEENIVLRDKLSECYDNCKNIEKEGE